MEQKMENDSIQKLLMIDVDSLMMGCWEEVVDDDTLLLKNLIYTIPSYRISQTSSVSFDYKKYMCSHKPSTAIPR